MVLNNLLDLGLKLGVDKSKSDLLEERILGGKVTTELGLPLGDLVNRNRVEETVDTSVDDRDLDLSGQRLVLTLLCRDISRYTSRMCI